MELLLKTDRFLWRRVVPLLQPGFFRMKLISALSLFYISLYKMPRKFLLHFLVGKGTPLHVSTREVVTGNPEVYDEVIEWASRSINRDGAQADLFVSQVKVNNPAHKYSVGSFSLKCQVESGRISLTLRSRYSYMKHCNRLTRHLHHWMNRMNENNRAAAFDVEGDTWTLSMEELKETDTRNDIRKYMNYNVLYV